MKQIFIWLFLFFVFLSISYSAITIYDNENYIFRGEVRIQGPSNIITNNTPLLISLSNSVNNVTNCIPYGYYNILNGSTSLVIRTCESMIITQLCSYAEIAGYCTATVYSSTYWSNRVTGFTVISSIILSNTGSVVDCYQQVPKDGGLWVSFGAGYATTSNGMIQFKGVPQ